MESPIQSRSLFGIPGRVLAKCWDARRDERNGFPFSAAMEWREAAGLCAPIALLADFCWREWERIMHLPRQRAIPIGAASMTLVEAAWRSRTNWADQPLLTSEAFLLPAE